MRPAFNPLFMKPGAAEDVLCGMLPDVIVAWDLP